MFNFLIVGAALLFGLTAGVHIHAASSHAGLTCKQAVTINGVAKCAVYINNDLIHEVR